MNENIQVLVIILQQGQHIINKLVGLTTIYGNLYSISIFTIFSISVFWELSMSKITGTKNTQIFFQHGIIRSPIIQIIL